MTPDEIIADLDRDLADHGEEITLQRFALGPGGRQIKYEVKTRMFQSKATQAELSQEIMQADINVILSPTDINRAKWPGATPSSSTVGDNRVPKKLDRIVTSQGTVTVQSGSGMYIGGTLVRIDARVRG